MNARRFIDYRVFAFLVTAVVLALAAPHGAWAAPGFYQQHNLVSDQAGMADNTDSIHLKNPWGIAFNPFGPVWISDNGSGFSTLYDGAGIPSPHPPPPTNTPLIVTIPAVPGADSGNPTGIVFNGNTATTNNFIVTQGGVSGPSRFIFATEDGAIAGWAPNVDLTHAILVVGDPPTDAVYKGLALSASGIGARLYATDFHNTRIDVWDATFTKVTTLPPGAFTDPMIPAGFGPFGIQAINGNIYVTYAKQDADRHDDVKGKGLGYVDVYDPNGQLITRFASNGKLNAPWGLALAPAGFGKFSNSLLVGNFGDGRINAFDVATGKSLGQLKGMDHHPIAIDGLWGIAFGNGFAEQPVNTLFFTAGPNDEANGLYGRLDAVAGDDHGPDDDGGD